MRKSLDLPSQPSNRARTAHTLCPGLKIFRYVSSSSWDGNDVEETELNWSCRRPKIRSWSVPSCRGLNWRKSTNHALAGRNNRSSKVDRHKRNFRCDVAPHRSASFRILVVVMRWRERISMHTCVRASRDVIVLRSVFGKAGTAPLVECERRMSYERCSWSE